MSEKIGGAKGTELDDEFCEMEKVCLTVSMLDLTPCQELVSSSDVSPQSTVAGKEHQLTKYSLLN